MKKYLSILLTVFVTSVFAEVANGGELNSNSEQRADSIQMQFKVQKATFPKSVPLTEVKYKGRWYGAKDESALLAAMLKGYRGQDLLGAATYTLELADQIEKLPHRVVGQKQHLDVVYSLCLDSVRGLGNSQSLAVIFDYKCTDQYDEEMLSLLDLRLTLSGTGSECVKSTSDRTIQSKLRSVYDNPFAQCQVVAKFQKKLERKNPLQ